MSVNGLLIPAAPRYLMSVVEFMPSVNLDQMYVLMDCDTVERIPLAPGAWLWVDENAPWAADPRVNERATALRLVCAQAAGTSIQGADFTILRNAVVTGDLDREGFDMDAPAWILALAGQQVTA